MMLAKAIAPDIRVVFLLNTCYTLSNNLCKMLLL
jgi:hypothetical protein